jgi:hypothetical protein
MGQFYSLLGSYGLRGLLVIWKDDQFYQKTLAKILQRLKTDS